MKTLKFETNKSINNTLNKNKRNGWIELYRFIAIISIILIHVLQSTYNAPVNLMGLSSAYWIMLLPFLKTGVAFFFIVSIYHSYNKPSRLPKFVIWIFFYTLIGIIGSVIQIICKVPITVNYFLINNWFIWILIIIYVISYLFNNSIDKISKEYLLLAVILTGIGFVLWSAISDFQYNQYAAYKDYGSLSGYIVGTIFLFLLINYIRHFYPTLVFKKKTILCSSFIIAIFLIYYLIYSILKSNNLNVEGMLYLIISQIDPIGLIFILSIFIILLNLKSNFKIFLFIGKLANGMFLLHFQILYLIFIISKYLTFNTFLEIDLLTLLVWFIAILISAILSFVFQILLYPHFEKQNIKFIKKIINLKEIKF